MTYDLHGSWDSVTGTLAPLYYQGHGNTQLSVDSCVRTWNERGAPLSKISIGLGFYGHSYAGAIGLNQPHDGLDLNHWAADDGVPQYYNIANEIESGSMTSVFHELSQTPYAYFNNGSGFVSYENEQSICKKTDYAIENNLNGFLIWVRMQRIQLVTALSRSHQYFFFIILYKQLPIRS
jgi:chitinase